MRTYPLEVVRDDERAADLGGQPHVAGGLPCRALVRLHVVAQVEIESKV